MGFAVPVGFHNDATYLNDAILGESTVEVRNSRRKELISLALGIVFVEAVKLGVIVANAVGRGLREALTLGIICLQIVVKNVFKGHIILRAATQNERQSSEKKAQKHPANTGIRRV